MCMIFAFSSAEAVESARSSSGLSMFLVRTDNVLFGKHWSEEEILLYAQKIEGSVRKAAHVTEYLALACSVGFFLLTRKVTGLLLVPAVVIFTTLYAASDEFHQTFVTGRSGSVSDVVVDSLGAVVGAMIILLISEYRLRRRRNAGTT